MVEPAMYVYKISSDDATFPPCPRCGSEYVRLWECEKGYQITCANCCFNADKLFFKSFITARLKWLTEAAKYNQEAK